MVHILDDSGDDAYEDVDAVRSTKDNIRSLVAMVQFHIYANLSSNYAKCIFLRQSKGGQNINYEQDDDIRNDRTYEIFRSIQIHAYRDIHQNSAYL